jgi:hypothetical protein
MELLALERVAALYKKYIPLSWRGGRFVPDAYTSEIHASARMEEELRHQVRDP